MALGGANSLATRDYVSAKLKTQNSGRRAHKVASKACYMLDAMFSRLENKFHALCSGRKPNKEVVKWLMEKRLLKKKVRCKICKAKMKLQAIKSIDGVRW